MKRRPRSSMFISSLCDVKKPTHYTRRVGDEVPGVVAVLCEYVFSSKSGRLGVMSLKRLEVCEVTKAKTAISQKDTAEWGKSKRTMFPVESGAHDLEITNQTFPLCVIVLLDLLSIFRTWS